MRTKELKSLIRINPRKLLENRFVQLSVSVGLLATGLHSVIGANSAPAIAKVNLASEPLYAQGLHTKPTLTLDLSVEFPTAGAAYVGSASDNTNDDTYDPSQTYLGYFDDKGCYAYDETLSVAAFKRIKTASTSASCAGSGFSGNFMNWATSSAIDILRYGLTGGDRIADTPTQTILQRAVLPTNNSSFYNSSNFPSKRLKAALVKNALPDALLSLNNSTYSGDVYVANCLDRVYFGTKREGSCGVPGNNGNLGGPSNSLADLIGFDLIPKANENTQFNLPNNGSGYYRVAFGANLSYLVKYYPIGTKKITCNASEFGGDPSPGVVKKCYQSLSTESALPAATGLRSTPYF